jgi:pyridoxamine 5'-phosphate oxidase
MSTDPVVQFNIWFSEAVTANVNEPNAMTVATSDAGGVPSCRVVLLKEFSPDGFIFFTSYASRKGRDIQANPQVSLLFFWAELARQIRIYGIAGKTSDHQSDTYFHSRPLRSQVAATVSLQSSIIASREFLDKNFQSQLEKAAISGVKRPPHLGGYCVKPYEFEFWQGREDRLHDRIRYLQQDGLWVRERLSP